MLNLGTGITVSSPIILIMERCAKLTFIYYIDFCFKGGSLYATNCFLSTLHYLVETQHDSMEKNHRKPGFVGL